MTTWWLQISHLHFCERTISPRRAQSSTCNIYPWSGGFHHILCSLMIPSLRAYIGSSWVNWFLIEALEQLSAVFRQISPNCYVKPKPCPVKKGYTITLFAEAHRLNHLLWQKNAHWWLTRRGQLFSFCLVISLNAIRIPFGGFKLSSILIERLN